jgi:hypothetical protein
MVMMHILKADNDGYREHRSMKADGDGYQEHRSVNADDDDDDAYQVSFIELHTFRTGCLQFH